MRFIQIADVEFNNTRIVSTKTYNLLNNRGEWQGGWKHRGSTNNRFKKSGFTVPYEVFSMQQVADIRIVFNKQVFEKAKAHQKINSTDAINRLFSDSFENNLLQLIKIHTNKHIKKELAFFNKYQGDKHGLIINELTRLKGLSENSILLRMGQGSGFHAITGDWYWDKHEDTGVWGSGYFRTMDGTRNTRYDELRKFFGISPKAKLEGKARFKSRKIALQPEGNELKLYPMGFVRICTEDEYRKIESKNAAEQEERRKIVEARAIKAKEEARKQAEHNKKRIEEEARQKEEARKPRTTPKSAFKKKPVLIDGIVTGQDGRFVLFEPLVEGMQDQIGRISYASGFPKGTVIRVSALLIAEGKKLQFQGSPKEKK